MNTERIEPATSPAGARRTLALLSIAASILVALVPWVHFACHGVDVPFVDDWSRIDLLMKRDAGTLAAADLWTPENEHRGVVPRALTLLVDRLAAWDRRVEMALSIALATLGALLAGRRLARVYGPASYGVAIVAGTTLHAWDNWIWAIQTNVACAQFGVIATLYALTGQRLSKGSLVISAAAALFGALSFLSGYLALPLGAVVILLRSEGGLLARARTAGLWALPLVALAVAHTQTSVAAPRPPGSELDFGLMIEFVARLLGSGLLGPERGHLTMPLGLTVMALAGLILPLLALRARSRKALLFPLAYGLMPFVAALMIAIGRVPMTGLVHAEASRYAIFVTPIYALACLSLWRLRRALPLQIAGRVLAVALAVAHFSAWPFAWSAAERHATVLCRAEADLAQGSPPTYSLLNRFFAGFAPPWLAEFGPRYAALRHGERSFARRLSSAVRADPPAAPSVQIGVQPRPNEHIAVELSGGLPGTPVAIMGLTGGIPVSLDLQIFNDEGRAFSRLPTPRAPVQAICAAALDQVGRVVPSLPVPLPPRGP